MHDFIDEARSYVRGRTEEENAQLVANWMDTAARHLRNEEYYRSMFERCGAAIGPWARTADDGSVYPDGVLTIRVVEWVERVERRTSEDAAPLTKADLFEAAMRGTPIDPLRALATYADTGNWAQSYGGEDSGGNKLKPCEWVFVGPMRPGYELAQLAFNTRP